MTTNNPNLIETSLWQRLIRPEEGTFSRDAAQSLLRLSFSDKDRNRMIDLAERNQQGLLKRKEKKELEEFIRVGDVLGMIHSKARQSLNRMNSGTAKHG